MSTRGPGSVVGGIRRAENLALVGLLGVTAFATLGYGLFGIRPQNLPQIPWVLSFFTVSFKVFAQAHIALGLGVLILALTRAVGLRWIPALAVVAGIAFTAEHVGTGYGFPFGDYGYTALLGPKLGGRVPFLIPLSWFMMAVPAFALATRTYGDRGERIPRVALAALYLAVWDLALDPAMSHLTPYWVWGQDGAYYGMPWVNLLGWYATGLVIMTALEALGARSWLEETSFRWMVAYYAAILLMPLGMVAVAGLWPAVVTTLAPLAALAGFHRMRGSARAPVPPLAPERT